MTEATRVVPESTARMSPSNKLKCPGSRITPFVASVALALLTAGIGGCGGSGPYGLKRVNGTVTYEDGSVIPAHRIEIKFWSMEQPLDEKTHPRPGVAEVQVDSGKFSDVSTYDYGDGAIKGRHKVVIMAMDEGNVPIPVIPGVYLSPETTPLEVTTDDAPFEFKLPKPPK